MRNHLLLLLPLFCLYVCLRIYVDGWLFCSHFPDLSLLPLQSSSAAHVTGGAPRRGTVSQATIYLLRYHFHCQEKFYLWVCVRLITSFVDIPGTRWLMMWRKIMAFALRVQNVAALLSLMKYLGILWLVFLMKIHSKVNFVGKYFWHFFSHRIQAVFPRLSVLMNVSMKHIAWVLQEGQVPGPRVLAVSLVACNKTAWDLEEELQ